MHLDPDGRNRLRDRGYLQAGVTFVVRKYTVHLLPEAMRQIMQGTGRSMTATEVLAACALAAVAGCGPSSPARAAEPPPETGGAAVEATAVSGVGRIAAAPGPASTPGAAPTAPPAKANAFHPDDDPACTALSTLTSETRLWMVAATPQSHHRKVAALWPTLPAACRGGTFYLVAAELVGRAADARLATADGAVVVTSPGDALARGLAAEPDHPRLLAHLAFADDLTAGQAPPLPASACERARARGGNAWTDDVAYVCALVAIHAGDGAGALAELERIHDTSAVPDLQIRRAQALGLTGRKKEALALAKSAASALAKASPRFDLTPAALDALKKKLPAR